MSAALSEGMAADQPIPPVDLSATTPDQLYAVSSIVGDSELEMVDTESIYGYFDDDSRLRAMPFQYLIFRGAC
jgi:A49-like RNA polymerase I associated factor